MGEHRLEDFEHCDMILKAQGVPLDSIYIAHARKNKIPVRMDDELFVSFLPRNVQVIGVTGTRGKTTVTSLIYHILKKAGKKVHLGGNIRGVATLPLLKKVKAEDILVCELDSWQLQGFGDEKISPHIAVFTNFLPDHLNYYMRGGNSESDAMSLYFADKANIFRHQNKSDYLICSGKVAHCIVEKYPLIQSEIVTVDKKDLPEDWEANIIGEHNRENLALGAAVLLIVGCTEDEIKESIESFKGVPGRLELVREKDGVKIYNDTTSTTPIAATESLS